MTGALALGLGGCFDGEAVTVGINEGAYVDVGTVAYQVQISRVLNPKLPEDRSYLEGLPPGTSQPTPSEQWFGVFLRAQNFGDKAQPLATKFRVIDTAGHPYDPIALGAQNPFIWSPETPLSANFIYPNVNSAAGAGPVRQGGLLLFKLSDAVYQNRPLVLEIFEPGNDRKLAASVNLDL